MIKIKLSLFLIFGAFFLLQSTPVFSMIETTTSTQTVSIETQKKELKKEFKTQKRLAKFEKIMKKAGIDFNDPVEKWFWFWILGWGAGLVLSALIWSVLPGGLWFLASLAWAFGTVSLIIWLIKKFAK